MTLVQFLDLLNLPSRHLMRAQLGDWKRASWEPGSANALQHLDATTDPGAVASGLSTVRRSASRNSAKAICVRVKRLARDSRL